MQAQKYNPNIHHRKSIRLQNYDYSQNGYYFITICTHKKQPFFGKVKNQKMILNALGEVAKECWLKIPEHFPDAKLHNFIIMPNHIHGIIEIQKNDNVVGVENFQPLQTHRYQKVIPRSIGSIIRGFKIGVTKWMRKNTNIQTVWQRNYYEHIIRNEKSLAKVQEYIFYNPVTWEKDKLFV